MDTQLPVTLASLLSSLGHRADHLLGLGLAGTSDFAVWDYASVPLAIPIPYARTLHAFLSS
ncbi:MAG: DUF5615 family PIN-like protein [Magnetococcales bacterium]|nr:DUF5615 family PIN-like protein [Magnetococcales bacterium]